MKISIIFSFTFRAVATAFKIFSLTATSFAPSATTITPVIFGATVFSISGFLFSSNTAVDFSSVTVVVRFAPPESSVRVVVFVVLSKA